MTFSAAAGRIFITDPNDSDHIVFDTDERLVTFTDFVEDTISVPQRTASSVSGGRTEVDINDDTVVASINSAANWVFGAFKVTPASSSPLDPPPGWFQATGTLLYTRLVINATGNATGGIPDAPWVSVAGHQVFTFRAESGDLIFNERTFLRTTLSLGGTTLTAISPACDVDFKLYCGIFV